MQAYTYQRQLPNILLIICLKENVQTVIYFKHNFETLRHILINGRLKIMIQFC